MSIFESRPWDSLWGPEMLAPRPLEYETALDMFAKSALADPARPLVSYFDRTLTSAEVDSESNAIACWLQAQGVVAGDRVALYLQNVPEFVIAVVAIWKAGAIAVPLNPMYRERELRHMLVDSGSRVLILLEHLWNDVASAVVPDTAVSAVLSTNGLRYLADGQAVPGVLADVVSTPVPGATDFATAVGDFAGSRPERVDLDAVDVAFLCYTSGTTGPPKGAMVTHRGIVFSSQNFRDMRGLVPSDAVLAIAPLFHITGLICSISLGFLVPMRIVLGYRFDVGESLRLIEKYRCTFTVGATTVFVAMLSHPTFADHDTSSLTKIIAGGAPMPPAVLDRYESATGTYLHNGYGLTETTSPTFGSPTGQRNPTDPLYGALALGVPLPGTDFKLVGDDGHEVGIGEAGEIVVRGPHVVPGYWNNPEQTANALRDGWLYTGDVAIMDGDGWVFMVDRKKDVINASGFKVWPREVEEVLYEHPAVQEAAVVGVADDYRGETVKAFVSLRPGQSATEAELIEFARSRLAAFKAPRVVEIIDELPKTVSGKILRRELRDRTEPASRSRPANR